MTSTTHFDYEVSSRCSPSNQRSELFEPVLLRLLAREMDAVVSTRQLAVRHGEQHRLHLTDLSVRIDLENFVRAPGPGARVRYRACGAVFHLVLTHRGVVIEE